MRAAALAGAAHVLRLDHDLSGFYVRVADDPDLAWAARAGRMLRSPTVFEDVVKTVCTTNCAWGATVRMVNALVASLGEPAVGGDGPLTNAFPTPAAMASAPRVAHREEVRAGCRGHAQSSWRAGSTRVRSTSRKWPMPIRRRFPTTGSSDPPQPPRGGALRVCPRDDDARRNSRLILDSWTRPKYARLVGRNGPIADSAIRRRFRRYGDHAGLAFWLFLTRDWVED